MGFKRSFKEKIAAVDSLYKKLYLDNDIELLHKYRVNLRKLYAYIEVFGKKIDKKNSLQLSEIIKKVLKPTSVLRDLDLFLIEIDLIECPPQAKERLHNIFSSKREQKFRSLLSNDEYRQSIKELESMIKKNRSWINEIEKDDAYKIIDKMSKKIYRKFFKIDYDTPLYELHRLRMEFKKFRYAVEAYEKYFRGKEKKFKTPYDLEKLQDLFGIIQDNNARAQFIKKVENEFTQEQFMELRDYFELKIQDAKQALFALIKK